jgi:hypothetical protein
LIVTKSIKLLKCRREQIKEPTYRQQVNSAKELNHFRNWNEWKCACVGLGLMSWEVRGMPSLCAPLS